MPKFSILNNRTDEVGTYLKEKLRDATFFNAAIGFFREEGYKEIADLINQIKERGGEIRIILGSTDFDENTAFLIRKLLRENEDLENFEIRKYMYRRSFLHSKFYFFGNENKVYIVVGSSNITIGGFKTNVEFNTVDEYEAGEKSQRLEAVNEWFYDIWENETLPLTEEDINVIKKVPHVPEKLSVYENLLYSLMLNDLKRLSLGDIGHFAPLDYQVKDAEDIAMRYYLQPGDKRGILLSHEVGLGKTIISLMVLKSLLTEGVVKKVVIVLPYSLTRQWKKEGNRFFDFDFVEITPRNINQLGKEGLYLTSYDFLRSRIDQIPKEWDMVIVDESHFLKNKATKRYRAISRLKPKFWLLLTATPIHNTEEDILSQLHLFVPEAIMEKGTRRELSQLSLDTLFNMFMLRRLRKEEFEKLEEEGVMPKRDSKPPIEVPLTRAEKELYEEIKDFFGNKCNFYKIMSKNDENIIPFIKIIYLEQFTSSKKAFLSALERLRGKIEDSISSGEITFNVGELRRDITSEWVDQYVGEIEDNLERFGDIEKTYDEEGNLIIHLGLSEKGKTLLQGDVLSLVEIIAETKAVEFSKEREVVKFIKDYGVGKDRKIVLFTSFIGTGEILKDKIEESKIKVDFFHGKLSEAQRDKMITRFRDNETEDRIDVLVATDAAYVGLNLQAANTVINYDLAWNPMVVEQRIGRVHRIGQTFDTVYIFSFILEDTVDKRKHEILVKKLSEITKDVGLSYEVVSESVTSIREFEKLIANFEFGKIDEEKFEEEFRKLIIDREKYYSRDIVKEKHAGGIETGFTREIAMDSPFIIKKLMDKVGKSFGFELELLDKENEIYLFTYPDGGKKNKELVTTRQATFLKLPEAIKDFERKYAYKLSRRDLCYLGVYHRGLQNLIKSVIDGYDGFFRREISSSAFPSKRVYQLNYIAGLEIENLLTGLKTNTEVLIPVIVDSESAEIKLDAKVALELAENKVDKEDKIDEEELEEGKRIAGEQMYKIEEMLKSNYRRLSLSLEELKAERVKERLEGEVEEVTRKLERLTEVLEDKRSSGIDYSKEEKEIEKVERRLEEIEDLLSEGEMQGISASLKEITLNSGCVYELRG